MPLKMTFMCRLVLPFIKSSKLSLQPWAGAPFLWLSIRLTADLRGRH